MLKTSGAVISVINKANDGYNSRFTASVKENAHIFLCLLQIVYRLTGLLFSSCFVLFFFFKIYDSENKNWKESFIK